MRTWARAHLYKHVSSSERTLGKPDSDNYKESDCEWGEEGEAYRQKGEGALTYHVGSFKIIYRHYSYNLKSSYVLRKHTRPRENESLSSQHIYFGANPYGEEDLFSPALWRS